MAEEHVVTTSGTETWTLYDLFFTPHGGQPGGRVEADSTRPVAIKKTDDDEDDEDDVT